MNILKELSAQSVIKNGIRVINWLMVIGLIVLGAVLSVSFFKTGLTFIIVGMLISPYMNDLLNKTSHLIHQHKLDQSSRNVFIKLRALIFSDIRYFADKFTLSTKLIVVFLGILIGLVSLNYETDDKHFLLGMLIQSAWLEEGNKAHQDQLRGYFEAEYLRQKEKAFAAKGEKFLAELQVLYDTAQYQAVINQGTPYTQFNYQIDNWVTESTQIIKQQQIEEALKKGPKLIKAKEYQKAYRLAIQHVEEEPKLKKLAKEAKKRIDKDVSKLQSWYEHGYYKRVIWKGKPYVAGECRAQKLVNNAQRAQKNRDTNKQIKRVMKKTNNLIKARQYDAAIKYASQSQHAELPKVQKLIKQAKKEGDKAKEKKILAKLRQIPPTQLEANIREYTKLVAIFPDNDKYKRKLAYYKKRLDDTRKLPALILKQTEYGENWPFSVSEGVLECFPPGIITFKVKDKTYAVNGLASSRGYLKIDDIWRNTPTILEQDTSNKKVELSPIINKGLELCNP
ncbi:MAG: hypothetical protein DRR16_29885 [Candidatus Parabeggiatoa sp. nov. 3]|nr:MAG: hypothetical protein DRR00_24525 [Gammaproteobacteria bacterium]RKZ60875.1 MAG: hypothetical protein DRQ99_21385 [Gammaproteobacteria bacterium]RKZ77152.1 MAG: hypothetical protein DRR16_29885 [Gammaproteobacteria bacterium]